MFSNLIKATGSISPFVAVVIIGLVVIAILMVRTIVSHNFRQNSHLELRVQNLSDTVQSLVARKKEEDHIMGSFDINYETSQLMKESQNHIDMNASLQSNSFHQPSQTNHIGERNQGHQEKQGNQEQEQTEEYEGEDDEDEDDEMTQNMVLKMISDDDEDNTEYTQDVKKPSNDKDMKKEKTNLMQKTKHEPTKEKGQKDQKDQKDQNDKNDKNDKNDEVKENKSEEEDQGQEDDNINDLLQQTTKKDQGIEDFINGHVDVEQKENKGNKQKINIMSADELSVMKYEELRHYLKSTFNVTPSKGTKSELIAKIIHLSKSL
jgi:hypothetical protein